MTRTPPASSRAQQTGWIVLLLGLLGSPFINKAPVVALAIPLLASIVLLGLPHGALDHRLAARIWSLRNASQQVMFYLGYLLLAFLYLGLWSIAPYFAFLCFLGLTVFHWGQADYLDGQLRETSPEVSAKAEWLITACRGSLPILLPVVFWPEVFSQVAGWAIAIFPGAWGASQDPIYQIPTTVRLISGFTVFSLLVLALGKNLQVLRRSPSDLQVCRFLPVAETVLLTLFFIFVHPLVAIGLYFPFWHGLRHLERLRYELATDELPLPWRDIALAAIPLTGVSIAGMTALGMLFAATGSIPSLAGLYLVVLAILTLPHALVVRAADQFGPLYLSRERVVHTQTKTQTPLNHA
ncbi:MAG: Brp/Blh family beta-carotene 15,15'-dioxygenase [Puniceicoccaceae bacterium]